MSGFTTRKRSRLLGMAIGGLAMLGCLGDDLSLSRDQSDRDQLHEELRRRLNVRVQTLNVQTSQFEDGELKPDDFLDFILNVCSSTDRRGELATAAASCEQVDEIQKSLCASHLLLEIVSDPSTRELVYDDPQLGITARIPPQTPATNTILARFAFALSSYAVNYADGQLTTTLSAPCPTSLGATLWSNVDTGNSQTWGEYIASSYVEAFHLGREALGEHQRLITAVADAEHSDQGDVRNAGHASLTAPYLSRGVATHLNLGGGADPDGPNDMLPGLGSEVGESGFCPVPRLTADGARALDLIRIAGPDPAFVANTSIDIDDLVIGSTGDMPVPSTDALARRLSYFAAEAATLRDAGTTAQDVYEFFGVQRAGWQEAREYLRQELLAFGRVRMEADAQPLPGAITTDNLTPPIVVWATTRMPPRPAVDAYYVATARYNPAYTPISGSTYPAFDVPAAGGVPVGTPEPLASRGDRFVDGTITSMQLRLADVGFTYAPARQILGEALSASREERRSRVRACWYGKGEVPGDAIHFDVHGVSETVRVVRGHAGLQCAVRGDVEGAPCDLTEYLVSYGTVTSPGGSTGFADSRVLSINTSDLANSSPIADTILFFLVEPRDSQNPTLPGNSEAIVGFMLPLPTLIGSPEYRYCESASVVPEIDRRVGELITPSVAHCAFTAETCAGLPVDMRLPLENELTSDGDNIESSWRHYLSQAQQAAGLADQLGEDLVRSGLEMDLRAESAIDELENTCGVAINLPSFDSIAALAQDDGACGIGGTCADPEYACVSGRCMLDPILAIKVHGGLSDADAERLEACLGGSATVPWATLGSRPVCLWQTGTEYCAGATGDMPCPYFAGSDGMCPEVVGEDIPMGATLLPPITATLNVFPSPESEEDAHLNNGTDPTQYPCVTLARLRQTGNLIPHLTDLMESPFMDPARIHALSHRLGWEAAVGDFSRVTWDRGVLYTTGNAYSDDPTDSWPCGADPAQPMGEPELCPMGQETADVRGHVGSLWCLQGTGVCGAGSGALHSGAARANRARMNDLLARAVIAARILGGNSVGGLRVPYYPRSRNATVALATDVGWDLGRQRGTTVDIQTAQLGQFMFDGNTAAVVDFSEVGLSAQRIRGAGSATCPTPTRPYPGQSTLTEDLIPARGEWTTCPYDGPAGTCVEIFDDEDDCDDPPSGLEENRARWDFDLPLFIHTLPRAMEVSTDLTITRGFWERPRGLVWRAVMRPRVDNNVLLHAYDSHFAAANYPLANLTGYWRRSGCGAAGGGACDAGLGGRHPDEEELIADQSVTCATNSASNETSCNAIGCQQSYWNCIAEADAHELDFYSTWDGNRAFIAPHGLTRRDLLNGLELLCVAGQQSSPDLNFGCDDPPPIESMADVHRAEAFLECKSVAIRANASMMLMRDVPQGVIDAMQSGPGAVPGEATGEMGAAVTELRAAFIELRQTNETLATTVDDMATEVRAVRNAVQRSEINSQLEDLSFQSQVWERITQCVVSVAKSVQAAGAWQNPTFATGAALEVAAVCANSVAQITIASQMHDLREQGLELDVEAAFINFEREFNRHAAALSQQATSLQATIERIRAALTRLENLRASGRRALSRALFLDTDETGRQFAASTVMRQRHSTVLARYREAHTRAIRLAYIAKRALEQRLAMPLDSMREDLVTVEAPAEWEARLCSMTGIDYDRIREAPPGPTGERTEDPDALPAPDGYAGEYVGDYVRRLEQVFESYSFAYPFSDGTDTAVLSVRDDLHGVRAGCPVEGPNLLFQAGHLDARATEDRPGWVADGCTDFSSWPAGSGVAPACVTATPSSFLSLSVPTGETPIDDAHADIGRTPGFLVAFGSLEDGVDPSANPVKAITTDTRYLQWVDVDAGRYRLSWYARQMRQNVDPAYIDPDAAVGAVRATNIRLVDDEWVWDEQDVVIANTHVSEAVGDAWRRHHVFVDVPSPGSVAVIIDPGYGTLGYRDIELGAFMLESATESVQGTVDSTLSTANPPRPFFDTTDVRTRELPLCEDTDGETFRRSVWTYGCVRVCADGYDGSCRSDAARSRCYYQTTFDVSSDWLQRRSIAATAGFASGNYNYRVESVSANLVGVGLRDCSSTRDGTPSGCYASGNVAYSIYHNGPYLVRNARGQLYSAPLFPGRIESARALAAERYLTNPLSSADRGLVEPYTRSELRGRPLGGSFVLRIWDDEGFRFDRLEDVQLVLGYRYWTRQE